MRKQLFVPVVLSIIVFCLALLACTPPFDRDGLIHHLQIPKLYLQHGSIYEIPELVFSYYPMNLDLLYIGALWLGSDILPKYIHMAFALATTLLLFLHLKKRQPGIYAWLGAVFFLSIPVIAKLSVTVYVDLGLVFFSTAAVLLLFRWIEIEQRYNLLLAGICCGLGIGTKYNGLLVLFILTVMVPVLFIRSQDERQGAALPAVKAAVLFCFAALLAASPWLIRNAVWTGNPVYPLYNGFFNRAAAPTTAEQAETSSEEAKLQGGRVRGVFATRHVLYGENIWQLLLLPVRIFFEGQDDDPRYFDGRLNPFLLLLPLLALLRIRQSERQVRLEQTAMAAFCLLYFLFAFNTGVLRIRYLVPMVPFLVILSMQGLHRLELLAGKRSLALAVWLIPAALMLAWNGSYMYQQFQKVDPLSYISGRLSRDEYLARQIPEYPLLQHINSKLPESAKILCIFMGWRGYYINREHWFDQYGNSKGLLAWLRRPEMTAEKIGQNLAERNTSYLLIRRDLLYQWLQNEEVSTQQRWVEMEQQHLLPLASHLDYTLYQASF
ncbi:ArnT family glycosyltransferase [Candidatus Electronema sp. PJ]|uniref:ArnT family glycosyltransferase n=1 Tax=Candidatus Electronema sp. PJ TaxID=3401572 RepID=UPI003AA91B38